MNALPTHAVIREVGLRDGLQSIRNITALLALRAKVAGWLEGEPTNGSLWRAGLPKGFARV